MLCGQPQISVEFKICGNIFLKLLVHSKGIVPLVVYKHTYHHIVMLKTLIFMRFDLCNSTILRNDRILLLTLNIHLMTFVATHEPKNVKPTLTKNVKLQNAQFCFRYTYICMYVCLTC